MYEVDNIQKIHRAWGYTMLSGPTSHDPDNFGTAKEYKVH